ncbi:hypothetical protein NECAME_01406 [Necator americanus]|uniref:Nucleotide-diphospho-sugar transferase domain-containing protein n=1 Tax=Necator americanus TaxID=51031 RepID=W2TWR5_NECAM|nr:hypothetical protein NECAME_01406 [Necator americanus]ETN85516.1 hypothetical protein NECAME_01406 [Necator americanus]
MVVPTTKILDRDDSLDLNNKRSAVRSLNITIVVVINDERQMDEYRFALDTVRCYSFMHNYPFRIVKGDEYQHCRHQDIMFRRHCVVAEVLQTTDWVLFIDADIGVVNPTRLIEEYVDTRFDITFYDRFCSWEVAMGSYIVKNTKFSRTFLMNFANFERQLPDSFHGSDNGAIHGTGWVRDIWITNSMWSLERDFMLHGMKEKCPTGNVEWHYDTRLRVPRATIEEQLREIARVVEKERWSALGRVKDYL